MNLMEQCKIWNENDEYQNIVDAIEALSEEERTPELISELARAYNNLADVEDKALFKKAVDLLKSVEDDFKDDHNWNFRIGYAYYYLDQEGTALRRFEKALEARPGDEDTQEMIDACREHLVIPRFKKTFRERTRDGWRAFLSGEEELRAMMDRKELGEPLIERAGECLAPVLPEQAFELGFNGEKYELILSPEGDRARVFELAYFQRHAPAQILEHWNIWVGRQPSRGFGLRAFDQDISGEDVLVWVEKAEHGCVSLALFSEKLSPLLKEDEDRVWWLLSVLLDQILGEIPAIAIVDGFEVLDAPREKPGIPMGDLPEVLEKMGLDLSGDPARLFENGYSAYEGEPEQDPDEDLRLDVFAGITCCPVLVSEYLHNESDTMDAFHRDGAVPGFFYYPLDCFQDEEERGKAVLDFRDSLEASILKNAGEDAVIFTGGASGLYCGYLDLIAWDLPAVLHAAVEALKDSPVAWAGFHTFRRDVGGVILKDDTDEEEVTGDSSGEESPDNSDSVGSFVGFALLSQVRWDKEQLIRDLKADWGLEAVSEEDGKDSLIFTAGDRMAAVSLMPAPVPGGEAERNAANNYMWPQAVEAAKNHKAHLMVAVLGKEASLIERGKLFVQVMASCCRQENITGVYASGTVFEPEFYRDFAGMMKEGGLPVFNWIWFGLYHNERGTSAYTYGMEIFGKDEMEVLDTGAQPGDLRDFLADLVCYVLEQDVTLHDGETIGFSEEQKLPITRSKGVSLDGMTLKIGYESLPEATNIRKDTDKDILDFDTTLFGHLRFQASEGLFEDYALEIDGRSLTANLYLREHAVNRDNISLVQQELERLPQMYQTAREFLYGQYKSNQTIQKFIESHREEMDAEVLCNYFQVESPELLTDEQFIEKLELRTLAIKPQEDGEDCTLDFSIDEDLSDELLVVRINRQGEITDLCWES